MHRGILGALACRGKLSRWPDGIRAKQLLVQQFEYAPSGFGTSRRFVVLGIAAGSGMLGRT